MLFFLLIDLDEPMVEPGETSLGIADDEDLPNVNEGLAEKSTGSPPVASGVSRRGRRRVMKKKTVKDEEGYLGWFKTSWLILTFPLEL